METVAVYEEHPIRVYGLKAQEGLLLMRAAWPLEDRTAPADLLQANSAELTPVFLNHRLAGEQWELTLCLPQAQEDALCNMWEGCGLYLTEPAKEVSLIHLQGPHFGDRYGILSEALTALAEAGVKPLAVGGVVHSVFLAIAPSESQATLEALSKRFSPAG